MFIGNRRNLIALAAAVALGPTAVGCGGGAGRPAGLPSVSAASAPTPSARSAPVARPERTSLPERAAARDVVRHYYRVFNTLHRTMNAAPLAALFTADCPCQAQVHSIRSAAARGEHYIDRASVNVMRPGVQDTRHAYVLVNLDTAPGGLVTANGRTVTTLAPQHGIQRVFRLVRHGRRWLISRIESG